MSRDEVAVHTRRIAELAAEVSSNPRMLAELQRARREFFGADARAPSDEAAEHRFAEWFLLERESDALGAVPITVAPYADRGDELEESIAGLFLVESVDGAVTARDMQNGEVLELSEHGSLQAGDLLVGRLYPAEKQRWSASAATPALRPGRALAEAFCRDLAQLALDRRLYQVELEHLLLRRHGQADDAIVPGPTPAPVAPLEHLEADLDKLLTAARARYTVEEISQRLAEAPRPGAVVGPLLDQLAFDTGVDLDKVRRLLVELWNAHHEGEVNEEVERAAQSSGPPGETLGEQLVRTLDQGLAEDQDVDQLFARLEQLAGSEPDDDDADASPDPTPSPQSPAPERPEGSGETAEEQDDGDSGDLGPLVTEFYWEVGGEAPDGDPLRLLVELQQHLPVPNTFLDTLTSRDLMRLLLHVYLRSAPTERAARVRAAFAELSRFYAWAAEAQELELRDALKDCEGTLLDQLDRLQEAGVALTSDAAPEQAPGLLQVEEVGADGFGARDDDGGSYWLLAAPAALTHVRVGDLVLAGLNQPAGGGATSLHRVAAGLVVVLPIDARSLIE
jgi:hypothetical protein